MRNFTSIWEAIQNGTFLTVDGRTYRIDSTDPDQMSKDAEDYCVITHDENTGEEQFWYFNEIEALVKSGESIRVQALCYATFGNNSNDSEDAIRCENKPKHKNASFDLLDGTGETSGRKVKITESDCDVHIDVEHYRINLQNYNGDFELTIVDKLIDANVENEEIHNIPLPCKT